MSAAEPVKIINKDFSKWSKILMEKNYVRPEINAQIQSLKDKNDIERSYKMNDLKRLTKCNKQVLMLDLKRPYAAQEK